MSDLLTKPIAAWSAAEFKTFLEDNKGGYGLDSETLQKLQGADGRDFLRFSSSVLGVFGLQTLQAARIIILGDSLEIPSKYYSFRFNY